jgi:hypothetical protein
MARNAASITASGVPTKVTTVPVGCFPGVGIKQANAFHLFYFICDLPDDGKVLSLAEVGYTFDKLRIHALLIFETNVTSANDEMECNLYRLYDNSFILSSNG